MTMLALPPLVARGNIPPVALAYIRCGFLGHFVELMFRSIAVNGRLPLSRQNCLLVVADPRFAVDETV